MEFRCLAVATGVTLVSGSHSQPRLHLVDGPAVHSHPCGPFAVPCSCPCHSNTAHLFITAGSGLPSAQTSKLRIKTQGLTTARGTFTPTSFVTSCPVYLPPPHPWPLHSPHLPHGFPQSGPFFPQVHPQALPLWPSAPWSAVMHILWSLLTPLYFSCIHPHS